MKPSFIFFGTPDIAAETLQQLFDANYIPTLIITGPDRPVGRGLVMTPNPVKIWADMHGITTLQPDTIDSAFIDQLKKTSCDIFIVVAYGKILPEPLIYLPKFGTLNIHYSLLPRWRGASPAEAAILANDTETGVTIQSMVYQLDAGDVVAQTKTPINQDETTPELRGRLSVMGSQLLIDTLNNLEERLQHKIPQDQQGVTKCGKIKKTDGEISKQDEKEAIYRKYRAYQPWPGIYYFDDSGKRVKITEMKRINGTPTITKIIPEGGKEIQI